MNPEDKFNDAPITADEARVISDKGLLDPKTISELMKQAYRQIRWAAERGYYSMAVWIESNEPIPERVLTEICAKLKEIGYAAEPFSKKEIEVKWIRKI